MTGPISGPWWWRAVLAQGSACARWRGIRMKGATVWCLSPNHIPDTQCSKLEDRDLMDSLGFAVSEPLSKWWTQRGKETAQRHPALKCQNWDELTVGLNPNESCSNPHALGLPSLLLREVFCSCLPWVACHCHCRPTAGRVLRSA